MTYPFVECGPIRTIGELRDFLENFGDDTPLYLWMFDTAYDLGAAYERRTCQEHNGSKPEVEGLFIEVS